MGQLGIELAGRDEEEYDHLAITGEARLGGLLDIRAIEGFEVAEGDSFRIMSFASRTGDFDHVAGCPGPGRRVDMLYTDTTLTVVVWELPASGVGDPEIDGPEDVGFGEGLPKDVTLTGGLAPNGAATLYLDLPGDAVVGLSLFDLAGRRVDTLVDGLESAGSHTYLWEGNRCSSGIFFARAVIRLEGRTIGRSARVMLVR